MTQITLADKIFAKTILPFVPRFLTPNTVSIVGVISMALSMIFLRKDILLWGSLFFFSVLADLIDGPIARYQNRASNAGKIVDIASDNFSFCVFVIGMIYWNFIYAWVGIILMLNSILSVCVNTALAIKYAKVKSIKFEETRGFWFFPNAVKAFSYFLFFFILYLPALKPTLNSTFVVLSVFLLLSSAIGLSKIFLTAWPKR